VGRFSRVKAGRSSRAPKKLIARVLADGDPSHDD
jgi:hypothetical protein